MRELTDVELLSIARDGDDSAFDELFRRHYQSACDYAAGLAGADHAQDRAAEAFSRIYRLVRAGRGPETNFRAYLLTAVRHTHVDSIRRTGGEIPVADMATVGELAVEADLADQVLDRVDASPMKRVFARLRPSWQQVLWHTVVLGEPNETAARALDLTPNALGVLAFRAREGLRQAYLADHLEHVVDRDCRSVSAKLPRFVRGQLTPGGHAAVDAHLDGCARCSRAVADLSRINENLAAVLTPAVVLSVVGGTPGAGGSIAVAGPVKVATVAVVAGAVVAGLVLGAGYLLGADGESRRVVRAGSPSIAAPASADRPAVEPRPRRSAAPPPPPVGPTARPSEQVKPQSPSVRQPPQTRASTPTPTIDEPRVSVSGNDQVRVADVTAVVVPGGARLLTVAASGVSAMAVTARGISCEPATYAGSVARLRCSLPAGGGRTLVVVHLRFADPIGAVRGSLTLTGTGTTVRAAFVAAA